MPSVLGSAVAGHITASATLTISFALGAGSNRVVYVGISTGGNGTAISGVTYDSDALTELYDDAGGPTFAHIALYRIVEADGLATGTADVVVTAASATDISAIVVAVQDVDQTTPNDAVDSANFDDGSSANTISSATGDLVVEFAAMGDPSSATTANTELADDYFVTSNILIVAQSAAGAASVVLDWTPSQAPGWYRSVAVNVNAASGGGGGGELPFITQLDAVWARGS